MLAQPALRDKLAQAGAEPRGGSRTEFKAFIDSEVPRTQKLVEQSGMIKQ